MKKIKYVVVSLFDGMSCGRIAFDRTEVNVVRYYSSEIDKYAIKVADDNYPQDTEYRLGSVIDVDGIKLREEIKKEFPGAKIILIGGSPCQGFSMAGKLKGSATKCGKDVTTLEQYLILKDMGFEFDGQSYLFWEYVRIKEELQPDYFFLENVRITQKWKPMFDEAMGVEPTRINSSLVSAQNRDRYYWHNYGDIPQPKDKGILLRDILDYNILDTHIKPSVAKNIEQQKDEIRAGKNGFHQLKCESGFQDNKIGVEKSPALRAGNSCTYAEIRPCELKEFNKNSTCHHIADATDIKGNESIKRVYSESGKSPAMTACQGGHREPKVLVDKIKNVNPSGNGMNGNVYGTDAKSPTVTTNKGEGSKISSDAGATYRKLTPLECERLQTLPDNYTEGVSNSQRYKMIGNGWTVDAIAHFFRHLPVYE